MSIKAKNSNLGDKVRQLASGPRLCKLFCSGRLCKYCDFTRWQANGQAIDGLYSSWVTHNILAMSRPSDLALQNANIVQQVRNEATGVLWSSHVLPLSAHC